MTHSYNYLQIYFFFSTSYCCTTTLKHLLLPPRRLCLTWRLSVRLSVCLFVCLFTICLEFATTDRIFMKIYQKCIFRQGQPIRQRLLLCRLIDPFPPPLKLTRMVLYKCDHCDVDYYY